MTRKVRVAVIGGGLGGLCAASALLHHGHEVHVYEAAPHLLEVGGGLTLGPNAIYFANLCSVAETPILTVGSTTLNLTYWERH